MTMRVKITICCRTFPFSSCLLLLLGPSLPLLPPPSSQCELCALYPFAGGNYAFVRITLGRFPAFIVGLMDIMQYMFMTFISVFYSGKIIRCFLSMASDGALQFVYPVSLYVVLGSTIAYTWKKGNALPAIFIGSAVLLAILYLLFVFCTIPQMDTEKWIHNNEKEDELSFGMQFMISLEWSLMFTHGINVAFLLCDKVPEVLLLLLLND
jgi:hypothetical protein